MRDDRQASSTRRRASSGALVRSAARAASSESAPSSRVACAQAWRTTSGSISGLGSPSAVSSSTTAACSARRSGRGQPLEREGAQLLGARRSCTDRRRRPPPRAGLQRWPAGASSAAPISHASARPCACAARRSLTRNERPRTAPAARHVARRRRQRCRAALDQVAHCGRNAAARRARQAPVAADGWSRPASR